MDQNLVLDPVKKDYVLKNGSPVASDRVYESSYYALLIPRGRWIYGGANQGSLLHTLYGAKRSGSIEQLFSSFTDEAIKSQLIDTNLASKTKTSNIEASRSGSSNNISVAQVSSPTVEQFSFIGV